MSERDVGVLRDLLERVKAATGPDRRLDYEIFSAFATPGSANPWDPDTGHFYTASIDATVSLIQRSLPGSRWEVNTVWAKPSACVYVSIWQGGAYAPTPALALAAATLTALIAQETPDHG